MLNLVGCLRAINSNVCVDIVKYTEEQELLLDKEEKGFMTSIFLIDYHNLRNKLRACE